VITTSETRIYIKFTPASPYNRMSSILDNAKTNPPSNLSVLTGKQLGTALTNKHADESIVTLTTLRPLPHTHLKFDVGLHVFLLILLSSGDPRQEVQIQRFAKEFLLTCYVLLATM